MQKILATILHYVDGLLSGMKPLFETIGTWLFLTWDVFRSLAPTAVTAEVIATFTISVTLTCLAITLVATSHLIILRLRRTNVGAFVSYHHSNEHLATELCRSLTRSGVSAKRLPYTTDPDHDALLDDVRASIRSANVFICLPGSKPSFVDNEVSIAFALEKPILFVVSTDEYPSIPNSAKKGYPIFSVEKLEEAEYRPLVTLTSYLTRNSASAIDIYKTALNHAPGAGVILFATFITIVVARNLWTLSFENASALSVSEMIAHSTATPSFVGFILLASAILIFPYSVLVAIQFAFRRRLSKAVSGRFIDLEIPRSIGYSFAKQELLRCLFRGEPVAHHEREGSKRDEKETAGAQSQDPCSISGLQLAWEMHSGRCPRCNGPGPVDIYPAYQVVSSLIGAECVTNEVIACIRCGRRAQWQSMGHSLTFGWWSILGPIYAPLQAFRNAIALRSPPPPSTPSSLLRERCVEHFRQMEHRKKVEQEKVREVLAIPAGYCPNCDAYVPAQTASCSKCSASFAGAGVWKPKPRIASFQSPSEEARPM